MKKLDIEINNPTGLHARPAKIFVNLAKQYESKVAVSHNEKTANGKSLISMLTLGVECGSHIRIDIEGEDEAQAMAAISEAIESGLGEEELIEETKAKEPASLPKSEPVEVDEHSVQGTAASPGIVVGEVFQFRKPEFVVEEKSSLRVEEEKTRLQDAIVTAKSQLRHLHEQMLSSGATQEAAIFDVHEELLTDQEIIESVTARIDAGNSAAKSVQQVVDEKAKTLAALSDPLLSGRAADLYDIGYRLLRIMLGEEAAPQEFPDHAVIVVARDLTPSDTVSFDKDKVLGFCTSEGGPTSHTAIIARALGIPAVVGAGVRVLEIPSGAEIILDGKTGQITLEPQAADKERAQKTQDLEAARQAHMRSIAADPAVTQDGHRVEVVANIGGLADAQQAGEMGAEGVGLLRTEFLFLERATPPTVQEQQDVYAGILDAMQGLPVVVRTLDVGGDKPIPYIKTPAEENPFLGVRGIRLSLLNPALLQEQIEALLGAAAHGDLHIMFPMVSDLSELKKAIEVVNVHKKKLGVDNVKLGIMIEVPSAALLADVLAPQVDFFSIGTNDLTQYTLATDRMHGVLSKNLDGLHPAVLRLIAHTVEGAHKHGKWVGVCGELGSDPCAVPILVGLGVDELSVSVPAIPEVKAVVRSLKMEDARQLAQDALLCETALQVRNLTQRHDSDEPC